MLPTRENIMGYPEEIRQLELEVLRLTNLLESDGMNLKKIELRISNDVASETENEKKKYSNENMRKAEVNKRLSESPTCNELKESILVNKEIKATKEIDLSFQKRRFRACEMMSRMGD